MKIRPRFVFYYILGSQKVCTVYDDYMTNIKQAV